MFVTQAFAQTTTHAPTPGKTTTATGTPQAAGKEAFPPFNASYFPSQLFWLAITFIVFYVFLKRTVLPRIGGILEGRREKISGDLEKAARMKADADAAMAAYEQDLAEARGRAGDIAQKARDEAKAKADAERSAIEASLNDKLVEAEKRIAVVRDSAMKDVGAVAEDTAALIVERLIGKAPQKSRIAAAVKAVRE